MAALDGSMFLAGEAVLGAGEVFRAVDPRSGADLDPAYAAASPGQLDRAVTGARDAFVAFRKTPADVRATLLRTVADRLEAAPDLVERCHAETGIPTERVLAERTRTATQLRMFADVVTEGSYLGLRIDHADLERRPLPKPDLRHRFIPVGPVAVFGASNFPLAFSVAGGDTASALAAGCPVVVKAHEAHPGTSEIVGHVITEVVADLGLPPGTFSLIAGRSPELAVALVSHPAVRAVGFTGSRRAGLALTAAALGRAVPIPVFAEMASVNPVFVLPGALAARPAEIGSGLMGSVLTGFGQLCTSPGLVFVPGGEASEALVEAAAATVEGAAQGCMLTPRIARSFAEGVDRLGTVPGVRRVARAATRDDDITAVCTPALFVTDVETFVEHHEELSAEVFGSVTLIVRVPDDSGDALFETVLPLLEGQLTATVHADPSDHRLASELVDRLELLAGRIVFNGWPTGLEVNDSVIHGGPYPATSAPATTSVGTRAIERFLRPVAYQNAPAEVLPAELREHARGVWRRVDGEFTR